MLEGEGVTGKIAAVGMKFSGVLLDVIAPIGAFITGAAVGDIGLYGVVGTVLDTFLPPAFRANAWVNLQWIFTAILYFGLAFLALRYVPYVGRIVAGFLAGAGLRSAFRDNKLIPNALKPPAVA